MNRKAISPVIAVSLLIIVGVVAVMGFQSWYGNYSSKTFSDVEIKSDDANDFFKIDSLTQDTLFLYSSSSFNLTSLKIIDESNNVEICSFSGNGDVDNSSLVGKWLLDDSSSIINDYSSSQNDGSLYGNTRMLMNFDSSSADDLTSYNHDGTLNGGMNCNVAGISGNGCLFDGVNDYISWGNVDYYDFQENFSTSGWFYLNGLPSGSDLCQRRYPMITNRDYGYAVNLLISGKINFALYNSSSSANAITSTTVFNVGEWYHYAISFDGEYMKLYVNGILESSKYAPYSVFYNGADQPTIGHQMCGPTPYYFNGIFDEVAIYSKALSDDEVLGLYSSQKAEFIEFRNSEGKEFVEFDGVDDYISFGNIADYDFQDEYSVNFNFNFANYPTGTDLCLRTYPLVMNRDWGWTVRLFPSGKLRFGKYFNLTNAEYLDSNFIFEKDKWYDISVTSNDSLIKIYVNGNLDSSKIMNSSTYYKSSDVPSIGYFNCGGFDYYFNGKMGEISLYSRELSSEEVKSLYWKNMKKSKQGINELDISSCNLDENKNYRILGFTNDGKIEEVKFSR